MSEQPIRLKYRRVYIIFPEEVGVDINPILITDPEVAKTVYEGGGKGKMYQYSYGKVFKGEIS